MPKTQARPEIVVLLCDTDVERQRENSKWYHLNGRTFSKDELSLLRRATRAEFKEIEIQLKRYRDYLRSMDEAPDALDQFLAPFWERLAVKRLGNAVELMNEDERAELDHLLGLIVDPVRPFTPYAFCPWAPRRRVPNALVTGSRDRAGI
ncbi:hypothetical protein OOK48_18015 [Streptomyces viridodiastaticus]|uniref:hypothetical protein n=1 Tax=Streptomyces albogriseolus TaxID=1887 RepID=UPI00224C9BF7|nr:hypothetical protein [Streptomyces viridodiastaticus]MCX4568226.1 hypothetical protein [Streptomyces viridodiastaticus]